MTVRRVALATLAVVASLGSISTASADCGCGSRGFFQAYAAEPSYAAESYSYAPTYSYPRTDVYQPNHVFPQTVVHPVTVMHPASTVYAPESYSDGGYQGGYGYRHRAVSYGAPAITRGYGYGYRRTSLRTWSHPVVRGWGRSSMRMPAHAMMHATGHATMRNWAHARQPRMMMPHHGY